MRKKKKKNDQDRKQKIKSKKNLKATLSVVFIKKVEWSPFASLQSDRWQNP